jgi:DNA uptake protein ComE-like DNA-binding protein
MRRFPWWFLIPLFTFGAASGPMVIYGGARLRSRAHIAAGLLYCALFIVFFVAVQFTEPGKAGLADVIAAPAWLITWLAGTVHTAIVQRAVPVKGQEVPRQRARHEDPVLAAAQYRISKRAEARALLASDPVLAGELLIGRPDLHRQYDDGGLVDVNNVPAAMLASELRLETGTAQQIVDARERLGGFSAPDELVVYCDGMSPARLDTIRERLVFLPR